MAHINKQTMWAIKTPDGYYIDFVDGKPSATLDLQNADLFTYRHHAEMQIRILELSDAITGAPVPIEVTTVLTELSV